MKTADINISRDAFLNVRAFDAGVLAPLKGFCREIDYHSIVRDMRLKSGEAWPIPITLEADDDTAKKAMKARRASLIYRGSKCAELAISDVYKVNARDSVKKIFGTGDEKHPGVMKKISKPKWRIGGDIKITDAGKPISSYYMTPDQVKAKKQKLGWRTMVGFQTRNPLHRAHEYLQTLGMNVCDGLLVQPQIGWLKQGDFSLEAILGGYKIMIHNFYNNERVLLSTLELPMNYAGPREAVLHAIVRKNYGCTHFIIGRDHAGVGDYYGKYEAQHLAMGIKDLGIAILPLKSPFYCSKCEVLATENSCGHFPGDDIKYINGKDMREAIKNFRLPPEYMMRRQISEYLVGLAKQGRAFTLRGQNEL